MYLCFIYVIKKKRKGVGGMEVEGEEEKEVRYGKRKEFSC